MRVQCTVNRSGSLLVGRYFLWKGDGNVVQGERDAPCLAVTNGKDGLDGSDPDVFRERIELELVADHVAVRRPLILRFPARFGFLHFSLRTAAGSAETAAAAASKPAPGTATLTGPESLRRSSSARHLSGETRLAVTPDDDQIRQRRGLRHGLECRLGVEDIFRPGRP